MNSSCIKSLSELSASTLFQYADYSGKGINDLGLYEECLNVPNSSYYLLNIGIPGDNFNYLHFFSGLCFSENCSSFDIDNFLPNISKALNYSLDGYSIQSLKVDGNEGNNTMNSSSIGIIFILCLLAFLPFVYPIWNYLISPGKKENKPKLDLENNSTIVNNTLTTSLVSDKEKEIHVAKKEPKIMQFFKCFSLPDNYKQLMTTRTGPLDFFNGVRALSILYVIFGHDYYLRNGASRNPAYILDFVKIPYFLIIASGFYAVDVFFWLSGFFLAFVILDPATRKYLRKPLTYGFAIFHRYCRIIPSYLVCILIYWKIIGLTGSGPLWPDLLERTTDCDYLWRNVLFVDNLFSLWGDVHYCFGWGWYLSNDFQLFVFSLLIIFIYAFKPIIGKIFIFLSMAGCLAVGYYICYHNQFKLFPIVIDSYSITDFMNNYYYKPWCRAPPYLFGLYLGILYKEYMNKQKECDEKKTVNDTLLARIKRKMIEAPTYRYSCYVIGLFLVLFLTFFPRQIQIDEGAWSETFILIWLTFQRLLFVLGLNLILLPSLIVSKDIIAKILAWNVFGVITKISFGMYLVHYFIIERSMLGVRQATYYTSESILYFYFTDVFFTILVAAILSLCVEIPFINLEKFIKGDKKIREKKQTPSPS